MNDLTESARVSRAINSGQSDGSQRTAIGAGAEEPPSPYGAEIAQTAIQSVGMSTRDGWSPHMRPPDYALAVSLIFTKATNQAIILREPPSHVCSTSILWNSLAHDKRFEQVPMSDAAPGDIIIGSGWQQGADGYAGLVVDHGRIISNSSQGVRDNSSLVEIQRGRPEMAVFRYIGFWNYYRSKPLANVGFNPDEPRIPAGQAGGGQWTTGGGGAVLTKAKSAMTQMSYEFLVSHNPFMVKLLRDNALYLEDESFLHGVDPDLVRAIIMHESRGWGADGEKIEGWLSSMHGKKGTYGYGQLGEEARAAAKLSIDDAMTIRGSIKGAATWLAKATDDLKKAGIVNPTIAQIASQYNSEKQKGLVGSYGRQVDWTYRQIKHGKLGQFKP
jgi:hypothetical protein